MGTIEVILLVITAAVIGFATGLFARKPPNEDKMSDLYLTYGVNGQPEFYFAVTPEFIESIKRKKYVTFKLVRR